MRVQQMVQRNRKKRSQRISPEISSPQTEKMQWPVKSCSAVSAFVPAVSNSPGRADPLCALDKSQECIPFRTSLKPSTLDLVDKDSTTLPGPIFKNQASSAPSSRQHLVLPSRTADDLWFGSPLWSPGRVPAPQCWSLDCLGENNLCDNSAWVAINNEIPVDVGRLASPQENINTMDEGNNTQISSVPSSNARSLMSENFVTDDLTLRSPFSDAVRPRCREMKEATLLMHYLDHVFYVQFPFYDSSAASNGRGWLFNLLMQDMSVYHAALALSQYHRRSMTPKHGDIASQTGLSQYDNEYYIRAHRELQDSISVGQMWSGTSGLIRCVPALTCSLYLLFFEVRYEIKSCTISKRLFSQLTL